MLKPGENPFSAISGDLFEIRAEIEPHDAPVFGFKIRGEGVLFNTAKQTITALGCSAPLVPERGRIAVQILVDRTSLEVFCNGGRVVLSSCFLPPDEDQTLEIYNEGRINVISAEVCPIRSIWS